MFRVLAITKNLSSPPRNMGVILQYPLQKRFFMIKKITGDLLKITLPLKTYFQKNYKKTI